jgi:outer membrane lipoprotein carrier protein
VANRIAAACLVATLAFWAYTQTLLPGVDLGDTGVFQAAVLWPAVSARQAYPLYFAAGRTFVRTVSAVNPARGMNLFSAVWGAVAIGLLTMFTALITDSLAAGVIAALMLAFSYTFWSQAIIAEVYTLHLALVLACCLALYWYAARPSQGRLAIFFAVYAAAFGNHLSMILLLVPFTVFLLQVTPERRTLFTAPTIVLAVAIAAAGALQYWPNLMATVGSVNGGWSDRLAMFWFDTTKTDWRETMVLGIPRDQMLDRIAMWWFDLRQQFGITGALLAVVGLGRLWIDSRRWAMLVTLGWIINTAFAFTYNVGDTHVFYLPSHLFAAVCIGAAVPRNIGRLPSFATVLVILYAGWSAWDTWPAIDRHDDHRAETLVARLSLGVTPRASILVTDLNWQLENALLYYNRWVRPDVGWIRLPEVQLHFPFLVSDNRAIGRDVVLDGYAARDVVAAFGPLFPLEQDPVPVTGDWLDEIARIPRGSMYVLCILAPTSDQPLDATKLAAAIDTLTNHHPVAGLTGAYQMMAGLAGEAPLVNRSHDRPFRADFRMLDEPFSVRIESWLSFDTFRRAGFAHVIRGRDHALIVERGISLVWFDREGRPSAPIYGASLYAPGPRYRISSVSPQLALNGPGEAGPSPDCCYARRLMPMHRLLVAAAGCLACSMVVAAQTRPAPDAFARSLQHRYQGIKDFSADFVHNYRGGVLKTQTQERGKVVVKKPSRMHWTYTAPEKKEFVSDGVKIYSYIPQDKQVIVSNVPTNDQATTPALFLAGKGDIVRDFSATYVDSTITGARALKLVPKSAQPDYDYLIVTVDPATLQIRALTTRDHEGGDSTLVFTNLKENQGISDKDFEFRVPRGVDVITDGSKN